MALTTRFVPSTIFTVGEEVASKTRLRTLGTSCLKLGNYLEITFTSCAAEVVPCLGTPRMGLTRGGSLYPRRERFACYHRPVEVCEDQEYPPSSTAYELVAHITQLLDDCALGIFKRQLTETLTTFLQQIGKGMLVKSDMPCIVYDAWGTTFTSANISLLFAGIGILPVDKKGTNNSLSGRGTNRREQSFHRPPLADTSILVNDERSKVKPGPSC